MDRKIYLIIDNLKVHHATILNPWLEEHGNEIQLFYLPSYSPELNPDEYLNRDLKTALSEQCLPATKDGLKIQVTNHLEKRKNEPKSAAKLFDKRKFNMPRIKIVTLSMTSTIILGTSTLLLWEVGEWGK